MHGDVFLLDEAAQLLPMHFNSSLIVGLSSLLSGSILSADAAPDLLRGDFQAFPLEPLTKLFDGQRPLELPSDLPRCAARAQLKAARKGTERDLARAGVGNRAQRRAYARRLRLAPV